jgi:hypothetical protein
VAITTNAYSQSVAPNFKVVISTVSSSSEEIITKTPSFLLSKYEVTKTFSS